MYILYFLLHPLKMILLIHVHAFVLHGGVNLSFLMIHDVLSYVIVFLFCFVRLCLSIPH